MKIVVMLLLLGLAVSVPVKRFAAVFDQCNEERKIVGLGGQCDYDITTNQLKNPDCGRDFLKSAICETTFSDCQVTDFND